MIISLLALFIAILALGIQIYRYVIDDYPSPHKYDGGVFTPRDPEKGDILTLDGKTFEYDGKYWVLIEIK